MPYAVHPVTRQRWEDVERLFGPRGAFGGCWCMFNRLTSREFTAGQGEPNRAALRDLVDRGPPPGLLAYDGDEPVGWVALAPRSEYGRINRSWVTKPVDGVEVWSISCFVVERRHRGRGVATALLEGAVEFAAANGAAAVEGYPKDPGGTRRPDEFVWMGPSSMFEKAGFVEIARRNEGRPIMRKTLG